MSRPDSTPPPVTAPVDETPAWKRQLPSLGRIVIVPMDPAKNNGANTAPAIITRVWNDTMVNVRVQPDTASTFMRTSVELADTVPTVDDGGLVPHVWSWPART